MWQFQARAGSPRWQQTVSRRITNETHQMGISLRWKIPAAALYLTFILERSSQAKATSS